MGGVWQGVYQVEDLLGLSCNSYPDSIGGAYPHPSPDIGIRSIYLCLYR